MKEEDIGKEGQRSGEKKRKKKGRERRGKSTYIENNYILIII